MPKSAPFSLLVSAALCSSFCSSRGADSSALSTTTPESVKPISASVSEQTLPLKIGESAPDFMLPGIDGKTHSLADFRAAKVLMIAFLSNHCPDSHAAEGRLKKLAADFASQGFQLVAINPNNPEGLSIDELGYSKYNDGFDDMKKYAAEAGFDFPYLYDGETQATAHAYGCLATPHVFIFDAARKLRYQGQLDDSRFVDPATVKSPDARNAVAALLEGRTVPVENTKPHGCSTKWLSKKTKVAEKMMHWDHTPVDLEKIDAAAFGELLQKPTKRLRLINIWATWCIPCVQEFPNLVQISRQFDMREFEFISVSIDSAKDAPAAKAFLEKVGAGPSDREKASLKAQGRPTNSYINASEDPLDLVHKLDPEWAGIVPYSVLIDRDGKKIWSSSGAPNFDELKDKILSTLGTAYVP